MKFKRKIFKNFSFLFFDCNIKNKFKKNNYAKNFSFYLIELKSEKFSYIFVKVYNYLKENNLEKYFLFQNPLSVHISLYYLWKNLNSKNYFWNKKNLKNINVEEKIFLDNFLYFYKDTK